MKVQRARNPDERWGRETTAMALGLSTLGLSLIVSQLVKKPEVGALGAVLAVGLVVAAWPREDL